MLFFSQRPRFKMLSPRHFALLGVCALLLSLCGVLTVLPESRTAHAAAAASGTLVTAINAGGGATGNFVADTDYNTGNAFADTSTTINTSGVSNPAPQS
ncbi:MAG TPA: hypothetical protein VGN34_25445, partial [Ktedonobacteraceae bacterium]